MSYVTSTPQPSLMNLTVDDPFDTSRVKQLLQGQIAPTIPAIANSFDLPVTTMHLPSQQPTAVNNSHADIFTSENLFSGANANQGGLGNVKSPPDGNSIAQIARPRPTGLAKPLLDINVPSKAASPTTTVNAKGPSKDPFNDEFFN